MSKCSEFIKYLNLKDNKETLTFFLKLDVKGDSFKKVPGHLGYINMT